MLQQVVDQFVIHFDVCGTSRRCFEVLQDKRGLSVHFMLDIDGTIYQTLDSQGSRVACDDRQRPLDRHRDRQHRGIPRQGLQPARRVVSARLRGAAPARHPGGGQGRRPVARRRPVSGRAAPKRSRGPSRARRWCSTTSRRSNTRPWPGSRPRSARSSPRSSATTRGTSKGPDPAQPAARRVQQLPRRARALPRADEQGRPGPGVPVGPGDRQGARAHVEEVIGAATRARARSGGANDEGPAPRWWRGPGLVSDATVTRDGLNPWRRPWRGSPS